MNVLQQVDRRDADDRRRELDLQHARVDVRQPFRLVRMALEAHARHERLVAADDHHDQQVARSSRRRSGRARPASIDRLATRLDRADRLPDRRHGSRRSAARRLGSRSPPRPGGRARPRSARRRRPARRSGRGRAAAAASAIRKMSCGSGRIGALQGYASGAGRDMGTKRGVEPASLASRHFPPAAAAALACLRAGASAGRFASASPRRRCQVALTAP